MLHESHATLAASADDWRGRLELGFARQHGARFRASQARRAPAPATPALSRRRYLPRGDRASAGRRRGRRPAGHRHRSRRKTPTPSSRRRARPSGTSPTASSRRSASTSTSGRTRSSTGCRRTTSCSSRRTSKLEFTLTLDDRRNRHRLGCHAARPAAAGDNGRKGTLGSVAHHASATAACAGSNAPSRCRRSAARCAARPRGLSRIRHAMGCRPRMRRRARRNTHRASPLR